jgi:hypothetical protein
MTRTPSAPATALFYGAVWGLAEATLGHLLHLVRVPGLPGLVMVPIAVAVMGRAAARSRSAASVFLAGAVAASFKLFDLLVPGTDLLALSRPIQAILLEALAGAVWVKMAEVGTLPLPCGALPSAAGPHESRKRPRFPTAREP